MGKSSWSGVPSRRPRRKQYPMYTMSCCLAADHYPARWSSSGTALWLSSGRGFLTCRRLTKERNLPWANWLSAERPWEGAAGTKTVTNRKRHLTVKDPYPTTL
jgi:hypothetical protein